jgi:hypothetical protein
MTVDEQLDRLADKLKSSEFQEGETTIVPDEGQDLESFQGDVRRHRCYASEGLFEIRQEHQEKSRGNLRR